MKSCSKEEEEEEEEEIDVSAGSLVWVRRPNGTWWPGRVVGVDELSPSCSKLPSRSATPIKLLGRKDGSLDWYNLDRSTRVKTFRCGEYDELIEETKERAAKANRRSANERIYVRREDAILHALELEKDCHFDGNYKPGPTNKGFSLQANRRRRKPVDKDRAPNSSKKSKPTSNHSEVLCEQPDKCTASDKHSTRRKHKKTPNDSEDDATEGMKRMRDLHDLGSGKVRKSDSSVHLQTKRSSDINICPDVSLNKSDFYDVFSGDRPMNSSKGSTSSMKRKRTKVVKAHESSKKKSRHNLQGVENEAQNKNNASEKLVIPSVLDADSDSSGTSCEENLFDKNEDYNATIDNSSHQLAAKRLQSPVKLELADKKFSDGFINIPVIRLEKTSDLPPTCGPSPAVRHMSRAKREQSNHCIQVGLGQNRSHPIGSITHANHSKNKMDMGTSLWFSKGKRNMRYQTLSKNVDLLESFNKRKDSCFVSGMKKDTTNNTSDESPTSDISDQLVKSVLLDEVCNLRGEMIPNASSMEDEKHDVTHENGQSFYDLVPYAQENGRMPLPHRHIRLPSRYRDSEQEDSVDSHLHDVELVETSYQTNRDPLVSLMSKFNGKTIIGHQITVEVVASDKSQSMIKHSGSGKKKSNQGKKLGISPRKIRRLSSLAGDKKKHKKRSLLEKKDLPVVSCIPLRLVFSRLHESLSNSARASNS